MSEMGDFSIWNPAPGDNLKKYKIKQTPNIKVILKTEDLSKIKTIMVFA